ncbi:MAG: hypothetical protein ACI853_001261 [Paracoccaceae bacterium]|jgi:hypothetical protein
MAITTNIVQAKVRAGVVYEFNHVRFACFLVCLRRIECGCHLHLPTFRVQACAFAGYAHDNQKPKLGS